MLRVSTLSVRGEAAHSLQVKYIPVTPAVAQVMAGVCLLLGAYTFLLHHKLPHVV